MADVQRKPNQVFVRNLPYDVNSDDLLEFFQEIGPVKRASVANENGTPKGYGFVKFGLEEDAERAVGELNGKLLKGRKVQLELAVQKGANPVKGDEGNNELENVADRKEYPRPRKQRAAGTGEEPANKLPPQSSLKISKTVGKVTVVKKKLHNVVYGLPTHLDRKVIMRAVNRISRKVDVTAITEGHELYSALTVLKPHGKIFLVTSSRRKHAEKVVAALNGATEKSLKLPKLPVKIGSKGPSETVGDDSDSNEEDDEDDEDESIDAADGDEDDGDEIDENTPANSANKPVSSSFKLVVRSLVDVTETWLRSRECRLIVRNLSFQANEQNVLDKLGKFGPLQEVSIPKVEVTTANKRGKKGNSESEASVTKLRSRGFAFVTFLCSTDAKKAVEESAGLRVCNREVAVDFCLSKDYHKMSLEEQRATEEADAEQKQKEAEQAENAQSLESIANKAAQGEDDDGQGDDGSSDDDDEDDDDDDGEVDNMDAVGEEGDDATTGDDEAEADDSEMDVDDDLEKQAYDDNIASDDDDDDDDDGDDDGEDDGEDEYDDGEEGENLEQKSGGKKTPSEDVQEGCTVFMRDLAFDATQQNIKEALGAFGRVVMAVIVKDKVTGDSRGTAFAKFSSSAEASRCVEAVAKDNRAATVAGRPCRVDLAVDRAAATRLKAGANGAEAKDKRNLYLANEGLIVETKKHKAAMSDVDRDKRKRSQAEKKKKLLNPLYFVSAHRLSLRNIPKTLSDHDFKIMCLRAVKTGHERKLVTEEDMTAYVRAQGPNSAGEDKLPAPDAYKKCVKAAKVMLDLKKMKNGVPQSKRFGFVEFTHHAHALACLRELNNTPNVGKYLSAFQQEQLQEAHNREETRASRIIAEFTLENFNKVKLLASRKERQQKSKSEDKGHGHGEDDVTGKKRERKDSASHSDSVTPVSNKRQKGSVNVSTLNAEPARNATPQETRPKADKGDKAKLQAEKRKRADQKRKEKVAKRQAKKLGASPSVAEGTQASKKRKQTK